MSDAEQPAFKQGEVFRFGPFTLLPNERILLENDLPVRLGSRSLEILILLVENAGEFVGNDKIFLRVWPKSVVVQGNLRVHIAGLRKALGDGRNERRYIINVPNRGYRFIEEVSRESAEIVPSVQPNRPVPRLPRLPTPLNRVIGQSQALQALSDQIRTHRLVTLVGAGGIGKTTVALTVAAGERARAQWDAVHFVDLASLTAQNLVPSALAASLGLVAAVDDSTSNLIAYLHDKALLILFDNCEHLVDAVAALAEDILRAAPGVHILATSREPLRAEGEWVQRLQALDLPHRSARLSAQQAMDFSAIQLFVERASAALDTFVLVDSEVDAAIDICRRVDGIPLAIELAAGRIDPFGVKGIANALNDSFALLNKGRRTALARHQTMYATLDWSFRLLSARDRTIMARLSVFSGAFPLLSAESVAGWGTLRDGDVVEGLSELVAKSLVTADISGDDVLFRLLDTTRAYASNELANGDDENRVRRRHAQSCLDLLNAAGTAWKSMPAAAWLQRYGIYIDDVRASLLWAFSPVGDVALGAQVTAKSAPLLFQLSFAEEHRQHAKRALDAIADLDTIDPRLEFELRIVYGHVLFHTRGLHPDSAKAFATALHIAREVNDQALIALAYSSNWMGAYTNGDPMKMLFFARKFEELTSNQNDESFTLMYDRMKAPALHFFGDQREARLCAERGLAVTRVVRPSFLSGSQIDRRVSLGTILSRTLWMQGLPVQANDVIETAVDVAATDGESVAFAYAMAFCACPLAIYAGQHELARARVDLLLRHTREHSLRAWMNYGLAYEGFLDWAERGSVGAPPPLPAEEVLRSPHLVDLMTTVHPAYVTEAAIYRGENGLTGWCAPEILRVRGMRLLSTDPVAAHELLARALELARSAGASAWELRAAVTMATHWNDIGRAAEAADLLQSVLDRMAEGLETPDGAAAQKIYRTACGMGDRRKPRIYGS